MPVDLHVHSTASDGFLTPSELVRAAARADVSTLALTDHDSVEGVLEAAAAARECGVDLIAGVELSAGASADGDVHILGLDLDPGSPSLLAALAELRERRVDRAREMTRRLAQAGHPVSFDDVLALAAGGAVGRVHVAQALVTSGAAGSIGEAFTRFIGRDAPFHVPKSAITPTRALELIHDAGGVAVLAHPGHSGASALPGLVAAGLDGVEAYHAEHSAQDRETYAETAARHGLLVTGGSDFHGPRVHSAPIGAGGCPEGAPSAVRARATLYRL